MGDLQFDPLRYTPADAPRGAAVTITPAGAGLKVSDLRPNVVHELAHDVLTHILETGGTRLTRLKAAMKKLGINMDFIDDFKSADELMARATTEYIYNRGVFAKGESTVNFLSNLSKQEQKMLYRIVEEVYPQLDKSILDLIDAARGKVKTTFPMPHESNYKMLEQRPQMGPSGGYITEARAAAENEAGLASFMQTIKERVRSNWNTDEAVPARTPQMQTGLDAWRNEIKSRMVQNIATSDKVASRWRDFLLHDYSQRYGLDLAAQMGFPYQFWYSRTYGKMFERIVRHPGVINAYFQYRQFLEKEHADMPEWWRYNVSSNELFGLDSDNPLYFNLEAMLNPLNSLTGVDFEDPAARETWWGKTMQDMGRFGPTPWVPLQIGVGLLSKWTGHPEQAEAFLGNRLIPQTQGIRSATALLGLGPGGAGIETDPLVWLQMGGQGTKWEIRRIGRGLGAMVNEGLVTPAQSIDAAHSQSGPIWEAASRRAQIDRAPGNLLASIFGVGAKARSGSEIDIDKGFEAMHSIISSQAYMSPEEYQRAWADWDQQFPFMTAVILSRKADTLNDQAYVWSVLSRLPPGQAYAFYDMIGLNSKLVDKFYADKGKIGAWSSADRKAMMGAMESLGAILEIPPGAIKREWEEARIHYSSMMSNVPDDIQNRTDAYYDKLGKDVDEARAYLTAHPEVEQYLQYREQVIYNDPLLFKYYGGFDFIEKSWRRKMYADAATIFGDDIMDIQGAFFDIQDRGGDTRLFLAQHPQLSGPWGQYKDGYWGWLHSRKGELGDNLTAIAKYIPAEPTAIIRPDANQDSIAAAEAINAMQEQTPLMTAREQMIMPYLEAGAKANADFDLSSWIDVEAERRWPNVIAKDEMYRQLSANNPLGARTFLAENQDLQEFKVWERETRANYNKLQERGEDQQSHRPRSGHDVVGLVPGTGSIRSHPICTSIASRFFQDWKDEPGLERSAYGSLEGNGFTVWQFLDIPGGVGKKLEGKSQPAIGLALDSTVVLV